VPNLSLIIDELKFKIAAAIETVDGNMSEGIWDELDIYRVTDGAHIEQLPEFVIQMTVATIV
jgi:hypothetical protein